jgi:hypothetical protein
MMQRSKSTPLAVLDATSIREPIEDSAEWLPSTEDD